MIELLLRLVLLLTTGNLLSQSFSSGPSNLRSPFALHKSVSSRPISPLFAAVNSPSISIDEPKLVFTGDYGIIPPLSRSDEVRALVDTLSSVRKVNINETVLNVVTYMNEINRGGILVYDDSGKLAGIFTERDFVTKILDTEKQSAETKVRAVMTPFSKLITAKESDKLWDCRDIMIKANVRHLPIVSNETGDVLGVISMRDIIKCLQQEDLQRSTARFLGNSLAQLQEQARDEANLAALNSGESGTKQDFLRTGFVIAGALLSVGLLQGQWIHEHEFLAMLGTFILGYCGIVFETFLEFNKAGIALLMSTALWVIFSGSAALHGVPLESSLHVLAEKVSEVSEVVFFILGAMTIVEIVDAHRGFKVVTDKIEAKEKRSLMWVVGILTFFMSAILDNLTTTIVMVSLAKKLLPDVEDRKLFGALIVIAANAGGAWTPIGDVTTTMLWINGQISALPTITGLLFPSMVSMLVSTYALQNTIPANAPVPPRAQKNSQLAPRGQLVFATGLLGLLSVPVFKSCTGLPPYLGMLAALGIMWSLTDAIHAGEKEVREELLAPAALKKIDTSGVLFFLGILLSVGALDSAGILRSLAEFLDANVPSEVIVAALIGFASAIIDNVPLVAATMGMYDLDKVPMDSSLWQLIAYCAGTGGSLLVIGSAAGVALMGLEKVDFVWYAKRITLPALAGYLSGIGAYFVQQQVVAGGFSQNLLAGIHDLLPALPTAFMH